jgi:NSS family neurotransmitter:Na+ symporter
MAMPGKERDHWGSGSGFLLATLGSAIGLGNVWRFSYVAGENGGGAFLLVYLAMVCLVGMPLLLGEFAIGRHTQRESAAAIAKLAPAPPWRSLGLLGVIIAGLILAYYAVITGWVMKYLSLHLLGTTQEFVAAGYTAAFERFIADPVEPIAWQFAVMGLTVTIVASGVERGIESVSKLLVPALGLLLLALAVHGTTLPGFQKGVGFLFNPDWAVLGRPKVYLAALGQALFSMGLAMGVMVTYGSYLMPARRLPGAVVAVAIGDTLFSVTAGLIIFPAVFSFGLNPAQGPALAFVVLPEVFSQMAGGAWIGASFFILLTIAALTSAVSLLEVTVAFAIQRFGWSRPLATLGLGSLIFLLGIPASLAGRGVLDLMDFVAADILLPLNGLLLALFVGWIWKRGDALAASDLKETRLGRVWHFGLRYVVPLLMAGVLVCSVLGAQASPAMVCTSASSSCSNGWATACNRSRTATSASDASPLRACSRSRKSGRGAMQSTMANGTPSSRASAWARSRSSRRRNAASRMTG